MAATMPPVAGSTSREPWHIDVMLEELRQKLRSEDNFLSRQASEGRIPQKAKDFKLDCLREVIALLELVERAEARLLKACRDSEETRLPVDQIEGLILDWRRDLAERAALAEDAPAEKPVSGVRGGQKSLLVYGAAQGQA